MKNSRIRQERFADIKNIKVSQNEIDDIDSIDDIDETENWEIKDKKRIYYTRMALENMFNTTKRIIYSKRTKQISDEEAERMSYDLEQAMDECLREILIEISKLLPSETEGHVFNAFQELSYNSKEIVQIYEKVKNYTNLNTGQFNRDMENNKRIMVKKILDTYRNDKEKITQQEYEMLILYKENSSLGEKLKQYLTREQIVYLERRSKILGKESEKIVEILEDSRKTSSDFIRNEYIMSLIKIIKTLKQFNFLQENQNREMKIMKYFGLINTDNVSENSNLEEQFSEKELSKVPTLVLIALNAFWTNRLAKKIEYFNNAKFIFQDFNLFKKFITTPKEYKEFPNDIISDEEIEKELMKIMVLTNLTQKCILNAISNGRSNKTAADDNIEYDSTTYITDICAEYQDKYFKHFNKLLPQCTNILGDDIANKYFTGRNMVENLYGSKEATQITLLESCIKGSIENWGYIKDEQDKGFVILGFDIKGLNMPLRLHMNKDEIIDFLNANRLEHKIPIYLGAEDFKINGKIIGTQVLRTSSRDDKQILKNVVVDFQKEPERARFIEHCKYISEVADFPKHLKKMKIIGKGKKQKIKYVMEKEYIDLDTKDVFKKNKDGVFEKIEEKMKE